MLSQSCSLNQSQRQGFYLFNNDPDYRSWVAQALKAFKKFMVDKQCFCTCNMSRLRECDRLGNSKVINLWRTTFFSQSPHFFECRGVIFSDRPGTELSQHFLKSVGVDKVFLLRNTSKTEIIDPRNGDILDLGIEIPFASMAA